MKRDKVRRENRINGEQDRMEGNIDFHNMTIMDVFSKNYTYIAYIELLAFSVEMDWEGGRERSWNSKY